MVGTGRGNTERAGTRRPSRVGEAGGVRRARPLEGDYGFLYSPVCVRVRIRARVWAAGESEHVRQHGESKDISYR